MVLKINLVEVFSPGIGLAIGPAFEQLRDERARAIMQGQIAKVLAARGELAEVLRIRSDERCAAQVRGHLVPACLTDYRSLSDGNAQ